MGVATTNLSAVDRIEELVANQTLEGIRRTGRIPVEKLALQLAGTAPLNALSGAPLLVETLSALNASLDHSAPLAAWVYGDAVPGNNGIYTFIEGTPNSWARALDLPYSQIKLTDAGAGTANAIIATSQVPLPTLSYAAIMLLSPFEANTDAVTVAVNGAPAKPLKSNSGNDLSAGALSTGMLLAFVDDGTTYRLLSDIASGSIQAASEAARDAAKEWAQSPSAVSVPAGGNGTTDRSAKVQAGYAKEWAVSPTFVSSEAGGDGTTTKSAKTLRDEAAGFAGAAAAAGTAIPVAADRAALKAISSGTTPVAFLRENDREDLYEYDAAVLIATHQADADEFRYVAPNPAANGAWVRRAGGSPAIVQAEDVISFRPAAAGKADRTRVLTQLPNPANCEGWEVLLVGPGVAPARTWCDGERWWNLTSGAEISRWWQPHGSKLHIEFDNSRFAWGGAARVLGDLTAVAAGGYSLAYNFDFAGEAIVVLEYEAVGDPADWSGTMFSWTSGYPSGNRVEFTVSNNNSYGDALAVYVAPGNPTANFQALIGSSKIDEAGAFWISTERHRAVARIKSNTNHKYKFDNGQIRPSVALGSGALAAPTKLGFGCRAWAPGDPDNQLTGAALKRVTIYNADAPNTVFQSLGRSAYRYPVHLLGDSFLNLYGVYQRLGALFTAAGIYVPLSQDGVGATSITQQATRYTVTFPEWQDSTLVICEMGLDGTHAEWETAMKVILGGIKHNRWLVLEPAPNLNAGTAERAAFDERVARMRNFCGGWVQHGGRMVSTLIEAMAASTGSADDLAAVAARKWPPSLTVSVPDFHPNRVAGQAFMAGRIYYGLTTAGWV
ncbi:tail spike protein [Microcystis phage Mwe-Yong1]|nr:tail spike protein [Microcystis phage Mwe-Yong1]